MIALCTAQCVTEHNAKMKYNNHKHVLYKQDKYGCRKDGHYHEKGHEWKSDDCSICTCHADYITCCTNYKKPILKDPENCEAILNKHTCTVEVKRKDRTEKVCEIESWIA
ncbi:beta-microseminoprotein-like isoform X2 [Hyla sarda]|nr:beta-microseminoprotein-like isoform X2 [Hyla sarda]